jgi:hypothetical protein
MVTGKLVVAKSITEADWQTKLVGVAYRFGWITHSTKTSLVYNKKTGLYRHTTAVTGTTGYPDLFCLGRHPNQRLALELKTVTRRFELQPDQDTWIVRFRHARIPAAVVCPYDEDLIIGMFTGAVGPPDWMLDVKHPVWSPETLATKRIKKAALKD